MLVEQWPPTLTCEGRRSRLQTDCSRCCAEYDVCSDGTRAPYQRLPFVRALAGEEVVAEDYWILSPGVVTLRDVTVDRQDRGNFASFAGVIAHDLFNALGVVSGWADVLVDAFSEGPPDPGPRHRDGGADPEAQRRRAPYRGLAHLYRGP